MLVETVDTVVRFTLGGSLFEIIGNLQDAQLIDDVLCVVYTERAIIDEDGICRSPLMRIVLKLLRREP